MAHQVEMLILQHPLEVHNAKGSARLLHLSLPRSGLVTGQVFDLRRAHAAASVENFQPLLAAFEGFVAQQLGYRAKAATGFSPVIFTDEIGL